MMTDIINLYTVLYLTLVAAASVILLDDDEEGEQIPYKQINNIVDAVGAFRRVRKRVRSALGEDNEEEPPRKKKLYDYERANLCVQQDYLGPDASSAHEFESIFWITRGIFDCIMEILAASDPFFTCRELIGGEKGIYPEAKAMIALKQLAYCCAPSAFKAYFQMGKTTGRKSLKMFCKIIAHSVLRDEYLRKMTREDARRVSKLHQEQFGVAGCMGCLDCMHVFWQLCPVAWEGQFEGKDKDKGPSIVLEAMADYNCWFWHAKFGYPGT
jgi:Plant transposon protein